MLQLVEVVWGHISTENLNSLDQAVFLIFSICKVVTMILFFTFGSHVEIRVYENH